MTQEQIEKLIDKLIYQSINESTKVLANRLKEILKLLADMFAEYQNDDAHITWTQFNQNDRLNKELEILSELLTDDYKEIIEIIQKSQEKIYVDNYLMHMYLFEQVTDTQMIFNVPNIEQIKRALAQPIKHIKLSPTFEKHRKKTIERITGHIANGILAGNNYNDIAHEIKKDMGMSINQAKRVARTETARAQSESGEQSYQDAISNGATIQKYWDSTLDLRTRASHRRLDGKFADNNGNFKVGKSIGKAPRLLIGVDSASQNINCRCKVLYAVDGEKAEIKRSGDKLIPYVTYEEWLNAHHN